MLAEQTDGVVAVTDETFEEAVLRSERPVVVDFWAQWCPPCRPVARALGELAGEFGDRMLVAALDTDANPVTTRAYQVMSLPTLLIFRQGRVVGSIVGARSKAHLRQALAEHL